MVVAAYNRTNQANRSSPVSAGALQSWRREPAFQLTSSAARAWLSPDGTTARARRRAGARKRGYAHAVSVAERQAESGRRPSP